MNKPIRILSFFSGCGGLDLGFERAGFQLLYAGDVENLFCETIECNKGKYFNSSTIVEQNDIADIDISKLPNDIDFIIGGPPCQSFSASGRRAGGAAGRQDQRGTLFQSYGKIIEEKQPKGFLFENVRGIFGSNKGQDWLEIIEYFEAIGYKLDFRILDACDYGVAQHRERLILVGHKLKTEFKFPRPIFGPDSKNHRKHVSASKALVNVIHDEDLESLKLEGGKYSHLIHEVPPGENYLFFTEKRGYPNPIFAYRSRFSDFLYKAHPHKPTKTLIASPGKYTGPLHWDNRYFSVAEYKRLQGFPDDFIIKGNRSDRIKQIGNSVSPPLAYYLAKSVRKQIFLKDENIELIDKSFPLSFDKRKGAQAKNTRANHLRIALKQPDNRVKYTLQNYKTQISPCLYSKSQHNVVLECTSPSSANLVVRADDSRKLFAKMGLQLGLTNKFSNDSKRYEVELNVSLYGESDHSIQTMWNAVDHLVINSSNFHSLFEIYGHFTEPHPDFAVVYFKSYSSHPICNFAEYIADFSNCSKFLPRNHLVDMFGDDFGISNFLELVIYLRNFRFDVRCKEMNIAIDKNQYMIAYPFTLPLRKQMNIKPRVAANG